MQVPEEDTVSFLMYPVRCFTCGKPLDATTVMKYQTATDEEVRRVLGSEWKEAESNLFDLPELSHLTRICCRTTLMTPTIMYYDLEKREEERKEKKKTSLRTGRKQVEVKGSDTERLLEGIKKNIGTQEPPKYPGIPSVDLSEFQLEKGEFPFKQRDVGAGFKVIELPTIYLAE